MILKARIKMFTLGVPNAARFLFLARSKEDIISSLQKCFSSFWVAEELSGRISSCLLIPLLSFPAATLCAKDTPASATSASMSLGMKPDVCAAKSFTNLSPILWKVKTHKWEVYYRTVIKFWAKEWPKGTSSAALGMPCSVSDISLFLCSSFIVFMSISWRKHLLIDCCTPSELSAVATSIIWRELTGSGSTRYCKKDEVIIRNVIYRSYIIRSHWSKGIQTYWASIYIFPWQWILSNPTLSCVLLNDRFNVRCNPRLLRLWTFVGGCIPNRIKVAKKYNTRRIPSRRKLFNKINVKERNNITWTVCKSVNVIVRLFR